MASLMQKDLHHHTYTENGIQCSDSDCVLPMCINLKLGKLIKNDNDREERAENVEVSMYTNLQPAISNEMASVSTEGQMELWWKDLESLGVLELPLMATDAKNDLLLLDGQSYSPHKIEPGLKPCFSHGMQLVTEQPHSWIGEVQPRSPAVYNLPSLEDSLEYSRQIFSIRQPAQAQNSRGSSHFNTAAPFQDPPVMAVIRLLPTVPYQFRIQETEKGLLNGSGVNAMLTSGKSGKLFKILSLILQAFDSPHTATLEEFYVSALQKALNEIQAAKNQSE